MSLPLLRVLETGVGISFQDRGRSGYLRFGVPIGGAMDQRAAAIANLLCGNAPDAVVLEVASQGACLEVLEPVVVAIAGADHVAGLSAWRTHTLSRGDLIQFNRAAPGTWTYLALPGGFDAPHYLGSASANPRAGIGGIPGKGDLLAWDKPLTPNFPAAIGTRWLVGEERPNYGDAVRIACHPGPQVGLFNEAARESFFGAAWRISQAVDRTGYRLEGTPLVVPSIEIESEPVLPGVIQVPRDGLPVIIMPDGPTVGGYLKIGVVAAEDLARIAQAGPGAEVQFFPARPQTPTSARGV